MNERTSAANVDGMSVTIDGPCHAICTVAVLTGWITASVELCFSGGWGGTG
jgi:hypothetical protein